jgi:N-acetylglutamate synthase-like GNAT family acetyltransferase
VRGIDGPIRANVTVTVDPRQAGEAAHVAIEVDVQGYGMGKLILPVVIREARKEVPESCQNLKARLENGAAG